MASAERKYFGKIKNHSKRGVTVENVISILRKNDVEVNEKEAEEILETMYFLAKLVVNQNFK